ncbi:MAG TPA: flagellar export protein FliJ [Vicinamibacterales bacterium]
MRPFHFRPQAALDLRIRQRDAAEEALAAARAAVREAEAAVHAAEDAVRAAQARAREALGTAAGLAGAAWHWNWMERLRRDVVRATEALDVRRSEEARAAEIAREARKKVKVLERLKARRLRAWQLEAARAEQRMIDELAGLRFAARMRATHGERG